MKTSRVIAKSQNTALNTEMEREKPDTYTYCKLKKEKQKKGEIQKIKVAKILGTHVEQSILRFNVGAERKRNLQIKLLLNISRWSDIQ